MFVVIQGSCSKGFVFTGPFETRFPAIQWITNQYDHSEVLEIAESGVEPGQFIVTTGNMVDGFVVIGTFLDTATVLDWQNNQKRSMMCDPYVVAELKCP